jgi:hypothetical protein
MNFDSAANASLCIRRIFPQLFHCADESEGQSQARLAKIVHHIYHTNGQVKATKIRVLHTPFLQENSKPVVPASTAQMQQPVWANPPTWPSPSHSMTPRHEPQ